MKNAVRVYKFLWCTANTSNTRNSRVYAVCDVCKHIHTMVVFRICDVCVCAVFRVCTLRGRALRNIFGQFIILSLYEFCTCVRRINVSNSYQKYIGGNYTHPYVRHLFYDLRLV